MILKISSTKNNSVIHSSTQLCAGLGIHQMYSKVLMHLALCVPQKRFYYGRHKELGDAPQEQPCSVCRLRYLLDSVILCLQWGDVSFRGKLQISKDISRKRTFTSLLSPLKLSSPALPLAGWSCREPRQMARNAVSCPALLSKSKAGKLQWLQELRADTESRKELGKQRLISVKDVIDIPEPLNLLDIKSTGLFYYLMSEPS